MGRGKSRIKPKLSRDEVNNRKRQTWDRVDRYERIVVERIEAFHHY